MQSLPNMSSILNDRCHYCQSVDADLRPYGPGGAFVCFDCAMSTPERKKQTEQAFEQQLEACGNGPIVIGEVVGPYPLEHNQHIKGIVDGLGILSESKQNH